MLCTHKTASSASLVLEICHQFTNSFLINSHPFLVGIVSIQETCLISVVTSRPTEPKTFQEAWHYPIEKDRDNWRAAIRKEIRSMINRGVWRKTDRAKYQRYRRLIGNKWVFKIKRDGSYRVRLVALGYSQITGVDYTDNFAPVAHDVSFRIALQE